MKDIKVKRGFYRMRMSTLYLNINKLCWVKVKSINIFGDGSKSVTCTCFVFNHKYPFPIKLEIDYEIFIRNIVVESY